MLYPAPTTRIDPTLARGTILDVIDETEKHPAYVVMGFPNTSYKLYLETCGDEDTLRPLIGEMVLGRIFAKARRIDVPLAGGRIFDPCMGTPVKVTGTVVAIDPHANVLVINAGQPIALSLTDHRQKATQFTDAEFIACDLKPGAAFKFERLA